MLMFLSILTSHYAEEDFLYALPNRLIIGLVSLFVSILLAMIALGATLYLVFGDNTAWILIPIAALAYFFFLSAKKTLLMKKTYITYESTSIKRWKCKKHQSDSTPISTRLTPRRALNHLLAQPPKVGETPTHHQGKKPLNNLATNPEHTTTKLLQAANQNGLNALAAETRSVPQISHSHKSA
ncbi:hypothetical protein CsSME_00000394 [Camellia sinensis var. sinensis]